MITFIVAWRFGRLIISFFPLAGMEKSEITIFSLGLGLTALSLGIFLFGILGFLTRFSIGMLLAFFLIVPILTPRIFPVTLSKHFPWTTENKAIGALLAVVFPLSFLQALAPCTGMDALAYHLYLPKEFLRLGKMIFLPLTRESLWPFNTEMLFMLGLLFQGTTTAQLFHWVFYPLTAFAIYACARRYYGQPTAFWAVVFFTFTPAAFAQSGYAYVDLSFSFFTFLSVYAFLLADTFKDFRFYVLSGIFCGATIGAKYLGLGTFLILTLFTLFRSKFSLKMALVFMVSTLLVGGGWYLRSFLISGNPVFPLYPHLFRGNGYAVAMDAGVSMGKNIWAFLKFPWNVTMFPRFFGGEIIGPFYLILLPLLLLKPKPRTTSIILASFAFLYTVFLFTQSQHVRFLISVTPFLSLGAGTAFVRGRLNGKLLKIVSWLVIGPILLLHLGIFFYRLKDKWPVVLGSKSARKWLWEHERSFKGFDYLQQHAKPEDKILNAAEVRYFYTPERLKVIHWPQEIVRLKKQNILVQDYLASEKFDFIWVVAPAEKAFQDYIKDNGYAPVFNYEFTEKPDTFKNTIYRRL